MENWFEASLREPANSWRALRKRRADPPGSRGAPARRETFRSALQQAEEQLSAAAAIGYASRALNLYYGLQQAGRALSAAARDRPNTDYGIDGHGLTIPGLNALKITDLGSVPLKLYGGPRSGFRRLSQLLDSDAPDEFTVGEVWPSLYETVVFREAALAPTLYPPIQLNLDDEGRIAAGGVLTHSATLPLPVPLVDLSVKYRPSVTDFLARYPALKGYQPSVGWGDRPLAWHAEHNFMRLTWVAQPTTTHVLRARLTPYRRHLLVFPTLAAGRPLPMHPLLAWWAVLFALSMLTRYVPAAWTQLANVDHSKQATAVEFVLDRALGAVPDLVDEAIDQLAP